MTSVTHTFNQSIPKQKGIVIIFFVIALPFLLTMMALALDTGQLFIVKTELQNAVDACALSAGQELDGTASQFNRAQEAGRLAGVAHKVNFPKVAVAIPNDSAVTFAPTLNGSYVTASAATAAPSTYNFVRCTANSTVNKLITVPTLTPDDIVTARATASRLRIQSPCVLPIGVCSNAHAIVNNTVGAWISGEIGKNDPCVGNVNCYKWVVYNGATPNASNLANLLTGNNTCGIDLAGQSVTEFSGAAASPYDEYNTRFGVQKGTNPVNPDFTGYGYTPGPLPNGYPPAAAYTAANSLFAINAYSNATDSYISKKTALAAYQDKPNLPGYTTIQPTTTNATARRIGIVPVIPCTGGTSTVNNYMCVLMLNPIASGGGNKILYLEYLGTSSAGACTQIGLAGGGGAGPTVSALVQ